MPEYSAGTGTSPESLSFLQRHVATFGLVAGGLGLLFLAFRVVVRFAAGLGLQGDDPSMLLHLAGAGFLLAIWAACRRGVHSRRFIHRTEALGLVGSSLSYAAMGAFVPLLLRSDLIVLLALIIALVARAIYVPSNARRTFVLALAIGLPLLPAAYALHLGVDPAVLRAVSAGFGTTGSARSYAFNATLELGVWWTLITILTTATSSVVYGLRREVSEARKLGQYVLEEKLGEGGMGVVYRARHAMLKRPTAVKLLRPGLSRGNDLLRFEREVQLTARLSHPNTVTVFDYGRTEEGVFYYAMELLDGHALDVVIRQAGPFASERVLHVLHGVASALTEAHEIGLIHRDLKPANIILCAQSGLSDVPKVVDFGLVKDLGAEADLKLTQDEALAGTPLYMAPEAIRAPERVDGRSDLYALGAVGYFLLTGQHVFTGRTVVEVCAAHLHDEPQPPSDRVGQPFPADVERLLLQCLAKDPAARPQTAREMVDRLETCTGFGGWTQPRARMWWDTHGRALVERPPRSTDGRTEWTSITTLAGRARS